MSHLRGYRILYPLFLLSGLCVIGLSIRIQVLQIGEVMLPAPVGAVFTHEFTHSMYRVPVSERFRIEDGTFALFHVKTTDAALEYYGIERREAGNVSGKFTEFAIPAASIGNHVITMGDRAIPLAPSTEQSGSIHIRLVRRPLLILWLNSLWRY